MAVDKSKPAFTLLNWFIAAAIIGIFAAVVGPHFLNTQIGAEADITMSHDKTALDKAQRDRILHQVNRDKRIIDIRSEFPAIRLAPYYHEGLGLWIVEIVHEEKGEAGMVSVNPQTMEILEFNFDIEKIERDAEDKAQPLSEVDQGFTLLAFFWMSLPHFNGMALAWLSFLIAMILFGDFRRPFSPVHFDILLLHSLAPFVILIWIDTKIAFTGIFFFTAVILLRCLSIAYRQSSASTPLNLPDFKAIAFLLMFAISLHVITVYSRGIGDAGIWSAIGADYLWKTGHLPYGTEFGPNCIYGPLMYILFFPANWLVSANVSVVEPGGIQTPNYENFAMHGVQSTALLLDLITQWALYKLARKTGPPNRALAVVLIYALSPFILGITSEMGIERVSHIAGIPFILLGLLLINRPVLSGILLGFATGMLYYPIFLAPLWFAYIRRSTSRLNALKFLGSYAAVGLICLAMILLMVHPVQENQTALFAFVNDSIIQQQFSESYGSSQLSFWGQYPALASWGKPLAGFLFCFFCLSMAVFPRRLSPTRLLALSGAVLIGTQLVLSFAGGTYIGIYLAILILVLFHQPPYQ